MQPYFEAKEELVTDIYIFQSIKNECLAHFHQHLELVFCIEGEINININGEHYLLKKDEFCLSMSYDIHTYQTPKFSDTITLIIPTYLVPSLMAIAKNKALSNNAFRDKEKNEEIKKALYNLLENQENKNDIYKKGQLYIILSEVVQNLVEPSSFQNSNVIVKNILVFIDKNLSNELSLEIIAKEMGYNKFYVSHIFNDVTKQSITQYMNASRARLALELLQKGETELSRIYQKCGFQSQRNFNRIFKENFNLSPSEFIKTMNYKKTL
jgi:AraC-like DNA-binding protein